MVLFAALDGLFIPSACPTREDVPMENPIIGIKESKFMLKAILDAVSSISP
ncbi:unnamed protein product, partial [marine sediment metagenome]